MEADGAKRLANFRSKDLEDNGLAFNPQAPRFVTMKKPSLKQVIERHRARVMQLPGVVGMAVGLCKASPRKRCIQVYVTGGNWPEGLPRRLDGYSVELVRTSGFRAT